MNMNSWVSRCRCTSGKQNSNSAYQNISASSTRLHTRPQATERRLRLLQLRVAAALLFVSHLAERHSRRVLSPCQVPMHSLFLSLLPLREQTHLQDLCASSCIRQGHVDDAVKAPGTNQRSVNGTWPVGCAQHHETSVVLETIHLYATE